MQTSWLVALVLVVTSVSSAQQLVGVSGNQSTLYDVDGATGALTNPRPLNVDGVCDIIFIEGRLLGMTTFSVVNPPQLRNALIEIDMETGATAVVGQLGSNLIFEGDLARQPETGTLFGVQATDVGNEPRSLFTIDPCFGDATIIGAVQVGGDLSAMAFDESGRLFIVDTAADVVLETNPFNAAVLSTVSLSRDLGSVAGMTYDGTRGLMLVGDESTDTLYTLDPTTGTLAVVGSLSSAAGPEGVRGLTFIEAEDSTCDRDSNGVTDIVDILEYLKDWFELDPSADLDGLPGVTTSDLLLYLSCWFVGAFGCA